MAVYPILLYPDPVLTRPARKIKKLTPHYLKIIQHLSDTLAVQPGGIGIAAPQIGFPDQIAIVDVSPKEKGRKRLVLINPEILEAGGEDVLRREGCMSVPDYTANVKRPFFVRIRWQNEEFSPCELLTDGLEALCIQHELDHLNGLLFLHKVASLTRDVFRRKKYL